MLNREGNDFVDFVDFVRIQHHISGTNILSGDELERADVNGDGKISPTDYVMVRNHINGKSKFCL